MQQLITSDWEQPSGVITVFKLIRSQNLRPECDYHIKYTQGILHGLVLNVNAIFLVWLLVREHVFAQGSKRS